MPKGPPGELTVINPYAPKDGWSILFFVRTIMLSCVYVPGYLNGIAKKTQCSRQSENFLKYC